MVCWVLKGEGISGVLGFREEEIGGGFVLRRKRLVVGRIGRVG